MALVQTPMKKVLFITIISIALFPVFASSHNPEGKVVIHMNAGSFSPTTLTIKVGDIVVFENLDSQDRWPASNIHPSHSVYSEFDPKRGLKPGESWEFKFDKPGSWRFHDHLHPELTGTITVTGTEAVQEKPGFINNLWNYVKGLISKIAVIFSGNKVAKFDYENLDINGIAGNEAALASYLDNEGITKAMERLVAESNGGTSFDCHQQAHSIGRVGFELYGEEAFPQCDANCHSGCYHGAMESFLNKTGTTELAGNIDRICQKFDTSFGIFECLHGVGHGVLAYLDYDMPATITQCRALKDSFSQSSCFGGMFMENILTGQGLGASEKDHQTSWINVNDPFYPCNKIDQSNDVQYQCWQMQTSWMLTISNYNFDVVSKECLKAPKDMIPVCYQSFGRDIGGHTLRDPQKIMNLCAKTPEEYYDKCIIGALNVIIDFWGPGLKDQAAQLCSLTEEPHKKVCNNALIGRISGLFKEKEARQASCNYIEETYRNQCLEQYKN